jgi:hypothetical protein
MHASSGETVSSIVAAVVLTEATSISLEVIQAIRVPNALSVEHVSQESVDPIEELSTVRKSCMGFHFCMNSCYAIVLVNIMILTTSVKQYSDTWINDSSMPGFV